MCGGSHRTSWRLSTIPVLPSFSERRTNSQGNPMPIVNRANYTPCPSCQRWMHAPLEELKGNRVRICQECYERADAVTQQVPKKESGKMEPYPPCDAQACEFPRCMHQKVVPTGCGAIRLNIHSCTGQVARASEVKRGWLTLDEMLECMTEYSSHAEFDKCLEAALKKLLELRGLL